ncbi:acyltransferase family protein [Desulfosporosinus acididurans]|uniref:Acyltransferase family protein n=1 Tax=Desulfosporosinus acididurans TaxID=476652 RepID=A0A0J1IQF8_9FIRM|nr:acyltransferase family protein [Desulfosporosinus acididurans]KLU66916.1 acyltransferase family protein [Desulfosporosinus acididurans]
MGINLAQETKHLEWADILKGLGILTVVWGHAGSKVSFYMFWFHMPLFFWISGYLYSFKPMSKGTQYVQRKVKHLIVPYVFYLVLLTLPVLVFNGYRGYSALEFWHQNWEALLLGGSLLGGVYATFWFPTVLLFVQVVYDVFCRKLSSPLVRGLIIAGCFLLAYGESRYLPNTFVPWNLDVGLYAIVFYALGHLMRQRKLLEDLKIRRMAFGIAWIIVLGFIYLYAHHILDYGLDMKHRQYYYFGTNLLLPAAFIVLFVQLSMFLEHIQGLKQGLSYIGEASMVIMYLHPGAAAFARRFLAITPLRFFVIGIIVPLLFYQVIQHVPYGRYFALGETRQKDNQNQTDFCNLPNKSV